MDQHLLIPTGFRVTAGPAGVNFAGTRHVGKFHSHSMYQLCFIRSGGLIATEEAHGCSVKDNEVHIIRPGVRHHLQPQTDETVFYYVLFGLALSDDAVPAIVIPKRTRLTRPERLLELFHRCIEERECESYQHVAPHLVALMIYEIHRRVEESQPSSPLTDAVKKYIARHYYESLHTSVIAAALHYNAEYLERVFRKETGGSITAAIHIRRIHEARRLILSGDRNINEVAYACGFKDVSYFRRVFKRHTDLTPSQYRVLFGPSPLFSGRTASANSVTAPVEVQTQ